MCDSVALQMAPFEKGIVAPVHLAEEFLGHQPVKLFLVTLQELWRAETPVTAWDIAGEWPCGCVDKLVTFQCSRGFERLLTCLTGEWSCQCMYLGLINKSRY